MFISVADRDKADVVPIARGLAEMGYTLIATRGTAKASCASAGIAGRRRCRRSQEGRPNLIDQMKNGEVALVINTPSGRGSSDRRGQDPRRGGGRTGVTCITTLSAAQAAVKPAEALRRQELTVVSLQERFGV